MKGSLAAMQSFAFLSRDKFKDAELGEHFYKIISEDVEKTLSLLNCYCDIFDSIPCGKKGYCTNAD